MNWDRLSMDGSQAQMWLRYSHVALAYISADGRKIEKLGTFKYINSNFSGTLCCFEANANLKN